MSSKEIDGIQLPEPVPASEMPDEMFMDDYSRYKSRLEWKEPETVPMTLARYAEISRKVTVPQQRFSTAWREKNPGFLQHKWQHAFDMAGFELRKSL